MISQWSQQSSFSLLNCRVYSLVPPFHTVKKYSEYFSLRADLLNLNMSEGKSYIFPSVTLKYWGTVQEDWGILAWEQEIFLIVCMLIQHFNKTCAYVVVSQPFVCHNAQTLRFCFFFSKFENSVIEMYWDFSFQFF